MKKRILSVLMGAVMCLGLCGCRKTEDTDWNYIMNKGEAVIGITYYEPMNYLDENEIGRAHV